MRIKNPYKVRHYQVGGQIGNQVVSAITQNPVGLEGFTGGYKSTVTPKWESLHNFNSPYGATIESSPVVDGVVDSTSSTVDVEGLTKVAKDNSTELGQEIKDMTPEEIQWWKDTLGLDRWDWLTDLIGGDEPVTEGPTTVTGTSNTEKTDVMGDKVASDDGIIANLTGGGIDDYERGLLDYDLQTRPDEHILPTAPVDISIFDEDTTTGDWHPGVGNETISTTSVAQEPLVTGGWHPGVGGPAIVETTPTSTATPQLSIDTVEEVIASQPNIVVSAGADDALVTAPVDTDYGDSWHPGVSSAPVEETGGSTIVSEIGTSMGEGLGKLIDFGDGLQDRFDAQEQIQKDKIRDNVTAEEFASTPTAEVELAKPIGKAETADIKVAENIVAADEALKVVADTGSWHPGVGSDPIVTDVAKPIGKAEAADIKAVENAAAVEVEKIKKQVVTSPVTGGGPPGGIRGNITTGTPKKEKKTSIVDTVSDWFSSWWD